MKLTVELLRGLADPRSWARGEAYFDEGRVRSLVVDGNVIVASVEGQELYRVRLTVLEDRIQADCSCPMGDDGVFCKHCVAVGLTYIEGADTSSSDPTPDDPITDLSRIRRHVSQMERDALEQLVIDHALWDEELMQRLILDSATGAGSLDRKTVRKAITAATRTGGFVDYRYAGDFARGIEQVVHSLSQVLEAGYAEEAIPLIEYALRRVERAIEHMDDSDGYMGPILNSLQTLHHAACVAAKPHPVKLARRIFEWELSGDWDTFYGAVRTYADVFGEAGLAEYRRLAEIEWEEVPALGPGDERNAYQGNRSRLTAIMEAMATESGDLPALIDIMRRDLSSSYCYLRIAKTCKAAGALDEAVAWAERGIEAFPNRTDPRLCEFLVAEYRRLGREQDALDLAWRSFVDRASLDEYKSLKAQADRLQDWPTWRDRALLHLRDEEPKGAWFTRGIEWSTGPVNSGSTLVAVHLWEDDTDTAWKEACDKGCSVDQWLELAERRENEHPEDALRIRNDEIARLVNQTNNAAYREAIGQVERIGRLLFDEGREERFREYVANLRRVFKRKRNFMKMLDAFE